MIKKMTLRVLLTTAIALIMVSGYYFISDAHGTVGQSNFDLIALAGLVLGLFTARITVYAMEGLKK